MLRRKKSRKNNQGDSISNKDKKKDNKDGDSSSKRSPFAITRSLSCSLSPLVQKKMSKGICSSSFDEDRAQIPYEVTCNGKIKDVTTTGSSNSLKVGTDYNYFPETNISSMNLENSMGHSDSPSLTEECPTFKVEDYTSRDYDDTPRKRSIISAVHPDRQSDFVPISDLSSSPKRYGLLRSSRVEEVVDDYVDGFSNEDIDEFETKNVGMSSSMPNIVDMDPRDNPHPPSSPLLLAVKNAVDSLNQYEDFEILDEIGEGYFAEVFKVSLKRHVTFVINKNFVFLLLDSKNT